MKKILAIILALILTFGVAVTGFAAEKVTIPSNVEAAVYDKTYSSTTKETKWYSLKAVTTAIGYTYSIPKGKSVSVEIYNASGEICSAMVGAGEKENADGSKEGYYNCEATIGNTYYFKVEFNGGEVKFDNCAIGYDSYNNYEKSGMDLSDFKLKNSNVTKIFSGSTNFIWDVYEVSGSYSWDKTDKLTYGWGWYGMFVKIASDSPVYFENNCSTSDESMSAYKGLYTETSSTGTELKSGEKSYYAAAYDILNTDKSVKNVVSNCSILVYVKAGSKITCTNKVIHVSSASESEDTSKGFSIENIWGAIKTAFNFLKTVFNFLAPALTEWLPNLIQFISKIAQ